MKIRAIALDMDGTLLNENNEVDREIVDLLKTYHEKGIYIFLATGRTRMDIFDVLPADFPLDGMVTSNGAGCYIGEETLHEMSLTAEEVDRHVAEALRAGMYYEIHPFEGRGMAFQKDKDFLRDVLYNQSAAVDKTNWTDLFKAAFDRYVELVDELPEVSIAKVLFFHGDKERAQRFRKRLRELAKESGLSVSSSVENIVEVVNERATKATGLQALLKRYNLSAEELIVFGDGENDLPMFTLAGRAVAMKNAPDFVKAKAEDVTSYTNGELGVFDYLQANSDIFDFV